MMRGLSAKYLTTRGRVNFIDQLVEGTGHEGILGVEKGSALDELKSTKAKGKKKGGKGSKK